MVLTPIPLEPDAIRLPREVQRFLRTAEQRVDRIQYRYHFPAFVSSDYPMAYAALVQIEGSGLLPGDRFCEWGSGLGVVSCLAAMLGFRSYGVEASGPLVRAARRLAADFDVPAEFARGNYLSGNGREELLAGREFAWLHTDGRCGHRALGAGVDEIDLVYVYPWPDEESLVEENFERRARTGALLLSYHGESGFRLRRKDEFAVRRRKKARTDREQTEESVPDHRKQS